MTSWTLRLPIALLLTLFVSGTVSVPPQTDIEYDLLILNGRVLDGTGNPWFRADIAVLEGKIAAIGSLGDLRAGHRIDAADRFVAPGFIDVHSHAGPGLTDPDLSQAIPLLAQGVTTVIINPDGGGPVDLDRQKEELLEHGLGVNVARFVPHGSIRREVIGMEDRAPTSRELEEMRRLTARGMEAGAVGLSTGLFYSPASFAETEEVIELAHVVARYNGVHQSHIRDESDYTIGLTAAVEEIIRISSETGIPGIVTHIKALGPNVWGHSEEVVRRIEEARNRGVEIYADQYPYDASATGLSAALLPRWATAGGRDDFLERLQDPALRNRILNEMEENLARRGGAERISIRSAQNRPDFEGRSLREIAEIMELPPVETALKLLEEGSPGIVSFNMHEEDIRRFMVQNWTMTSSDGGLVAMGDGVPHPRNYGSFARKIRLYVMERGYLDLPSAIRGMTSLPARSHRIPERGVIAPGNRADLVIFDPAEVIDHAAFTDPHRLSEGFHHVIVNGRIAVYSGEFTGTVAGEVIDRAPSQ